MGLKHYLTDVADVKLGTSQVDKLRLGTNLVWSKIKVTITDTTVAVSDTGTPVTAGYELRSDGTVYEYAPSGAFKYNWLVYGAASDYEVRATVTGGNGQGFTGTTGVWMPLSTTRAWDVTRNSVGVNTSTLLVEIRRVLDGVVLDSATINLSAEYV